MTFKSFQGIDREPLRENTKSIATTKSNKISGEEKSFSKF